MAHIKRVVMQGFKSFAKRTEIPFDKGVNIIIGPNGSGKSNISDAICFALGRLSIKSIRAERARNLIFMGSKYVKPAKEAYVELVFDNSDRAFSIEADEIVLKRVVRYNGQSIYKINDETKTRAEIIETLGQAGIDPYGFNIILQGQIQSIVKMHPEDRRKIIGEVAGISVYEWRKEKSLKELEKTDERLKEISTVLRERIAYLNNLEKEKAQAQRYKDLQLIVKRARASITKKKLDDKNKEIENILKAIEEKTLQKGKKQEKAAKAQEKIDELTEKINEINKYIRKAGGLEQSKLREEITNLRAELEGLRVRKESSEHRKEEVERRIEEMKKSIPELEEEIKKLREESPLMAKKAKELKKKKEELAQFEEERKRFLTFKSELYHLKDKLEEKKILFERTKAESESLIKQIEELSKEFEYSSEKELPDKISSNKDKIAKEKSSIKSSEEKEIANEKIISVAESTIEYNKEIKSKVEKIEICPLCQSKITEEHIEHVFDNCDAKIKIAGVELEKSIKVLDEIRKEKNKILANIENLEDKNRVLEKELIAHRSVNEKKELLKKSVCYEDSLKKEVVEFIAKRKSLENKSENLAQIEEKYKNKMLEIEEISSRTEEDIDTTLLYKERELERVANIIERSKKDLDEIQERLEELENEIENREKVLEEKEKQEEELNMKFNRMFSERDNTQKLIQETSITLTEIQSEVHQTEDQISYLRIGKAKLEGEKETVEIDLADYAGVELLPGSINALEERLNKAQETLQNIGNINMRALEVYDAVKKEYDVVKEKADTLEKEKTEVLKIIEEIDKKKKKTFMKAFKAINELFSADFSKLYAKGTAYLELENKEDIFQGGVEIVVKMAKGKYFDVNSLSGGEQTLVAISLLFAIQEYKPYQFYLLDEIDAALDKRNSERLAALLNQYMKSGQYIVVTHNDAIILDSQVLYGISMHEGVSKILSLHIGSRTHANPQT